MNDRVIASRCRSILQYWGPSRFGGSECWFELGVLNILALFALPAINNLDNATGSTAQMDLIPESNVLSFH